MHPSQSPAEPICEDGGEQDRSSGSSTTRLRRTPALIGSSSGATTPATRLASDRPYRILPRNSSLNPADGQSAGEGLSTTSATNTTTGASPNPAENLGASRHADVQLNAAAVGSPRAAVSSGTATAAGASSPSSGATPTAVRGRSGSTTQYRVYQPSSLFGTNVAPSPSAAAAAGAAAAAAVASSLSSSQVLTDTTHRRVNSTAASDQNASAMTAAACDNDNDFEHTSATTTTASASQRRSFDASAGGETLRGSTASTLRRVSGPFSASNTVTSHLSTEKFDSTGSSSVNGGAAGTHNSSSSTANGVRRAGPLLHASALAGGRAAPANAEVPSPSGAVTSAGAAAPPAPLASTPTVAPALAAYRDRQQQQQQQQQRPMNTAHEEAPTSTLADASAPSSSRLHATTEEATEKDHEPANLTDTLAATTAGDVAAALAEADAAQRRLAQCMADAVRGIKAERLSERGGICNSTDAERDNSPQISHKTGSLSAEPHPEGKVQEGLEDAEEVPISMSSLVTRIAVPAAVQVTLKNPAASKEELWAALRMACQQCELLQRRLAKAEGKLTTEDDEEAEAKALSRAASLRNNADAATGGDAAADDGSGHASKSGEQRTSVVVSAPPPLDEHHASTTGNGVDSSNEKDISSTNNHNHNINGSDSIPPSTAETAQQRTRERIAAAVTAAPLSAAALLRNAHTRPASNAAITPHSTTTTTTASNATAPTNFDASSALRNRVAEQIRRVEASRRGSGASSTAAPQTPARRVDKYHVRSAFSEKTTEPALASNPLPILKASEQEPEEAPRRGKEVAAADNIQLRSPMDNASSHSGPSSSGGGGASGANPNVTVKVPEDAVALLSRRKVREAVVKSRETDPWPSTTSRTPLLPESQLPSQTDSDDGGSGDDDDAQRGDEDEDEDEDESEDGVHEGGSHRKTKGGKGQSRNQRTTFKRLPSNVSDTASIKSGAGFALPSIPSASADNLRKSSFMSRSHNSGRVPPPRPPSSSASESVAAASGVTGVSSTSPQQAYHRRLRGASFASVDSASNGREGSVGSSGPPNSNNNNNNNQTHHPNAEQVCDARLGLVPPISVRALTASTTLPALKTDDTLTGPLSARPVGGCSSAAVEVDGPASGPRRSRDLTRGSTSGHAVKKAPHHASNNNMNGSGSNSHNTLFSPCGAGGNAVQQSNWLPRSTSPASPMTGALPSIPSLSSPSQKSIVPRSPLRSPGTGAISVTSMDRVRAGPLKQHPSTKVLHPTCGSGGGMKTGDGRVLSPVPLPSPSESMRGSVTSATTAAAAPPTILEMVRQVAEEDAPVPPPFDDKKAELREWRRQAAKGGLRGAPPAC